ncbi:hypothetical protein [Desulfovibrio porci]|uniref:hypothetical protein n=1 Tax=Desulfovibrio porci TaxID=2605782 RepID=UPI003A913D5A
MLKRMPFPLLAALLLCLTLSGGLVPAAGAAGAGEKDICVHFRSGDPSSMPFSVLAGPDTDMYYLRDVAETGDKGWCFGPYDNYVGIKAEADGVYSVVTFFERGTLRNTAVYQVMWDGGMFCLQDVDNKPPAVNFRAGE